MSGHSKWSTIKHKKAALDAKRGKAWSKLSRAITIAARSGGNPEDNPSLRLAVDKAKGANMPKDTIEKAIKKGTGELESEALEEIVYEGYGPNGVAVMCSAVTDNRNRTGPEIKKIFERSGGNLGATNSVAYMFTQRGVILVDASKATEEQIMEVSLEAGAEDVSSSEVCHEITTVPTEFQTVKDAMEAAGLEIQSADISRIASNTIMLDLETGRKIMKLIEALEDHDDVDAVYSNADIPDEVAAQLANE